MHDWFGCVYVLLNTKTGKVYVGQTTRPFYIRLRDHQYDANAGCPFLFHRAIRKYGLESFVITMFLEGETEQELDWDERRLISILGSRDRKFGYNMTDGGEGGFSFVGRKHTKASKRKLSLALKGRKKHPGFGALVSAALKGKPKSEEHKEKLRGENNPMFGRVGALNPMFGKKRPDLAKWTREHGDEIRQRQLGRKLSQETKDKISAAHLGKKASLETRLKMSASRTGKPSGMLGRKASPETRAKISSSGKEAWKKRRLGAS